MRRARAGFKRAAQYSKSMPRRRPGVQTEMPPKQAALARQVRQRMNRLGKPEHRARFCFFSKKKSLAGTRRFPIPSKSRFRWALTAAPRASQPQKPFFNRRPSPALAPPRPPKPPHLPPASHHRAPWSCPLRACAGPEPGSNLPHGTQGVCRARRPGDANGNAAQTGGLARQVRQRMNRLGKPEHCARFCFFSKKKSPAGMRRFPIPSEIQIRMGFKRSATSFATPKTLLQSPPFAGALRHHAPQAAAFADRSASARPLELSHCAHAQGQSRVLICRTVLEEHAAPAA